MPTLNDGNYTGTSVNYSCSLRIKGKQLVSSNIIQLVVREWIFDLVPRIEIIVNDDGVLTEIYPLKDGDLIELQLAKNDEDEPIDLEFLIMGWYSGSMIGNRFNQLQIVGVMKVDGFYSPSRTRAFRGVNSFDVILQIVNSEGGRTVNKPNNVSPNDVMTWLQTGLSNMDMCKHVMKRAFIPDDALFLYGSTNGEFSFTSLKSELGSRSSRNAWFDLEKYSAESFDEPADQQDLWFSSFNIFNYSSIENIRRNYGIAFSYYDINEGKKQVLISDSSSPLAEESTQSESNNEAYVNGFSFGCLPPDNVHEKYFHGIAQNDYYRHQFFSGYLLELDINALAKPKLFEKINVQIPSVVEEGENGPLSGEYLVGGIIHEISRGELYHKRVELFRNGINKSEHETEIPSTAAQ